MKQVARTALVSFALVALLQSGCPSGGDDNTGGRGGGGGTGGGGGSPSTGGTGGGGTGGSGGTGGGGSGGTGGRTPDAGVKRDTGKAPDGGRTPDGGGTADGGRRDGAGSDAGSTTGARMATATIQGLNGSMLRGTVTFKEVANGIEMTYALEGCAAGPNLTHIHLGQSCQNFTTHWNRGEDIGGNERIMCGADGRGTLTYVRPNMPANLAWTIGGAMVSNLQGRPLIIHQGTSTTNFQGCGIIQVME
jgi:hypothetical protein